MSKAVPDSCDCTNAFEAPVELENRFRGAVCSFAKRELLAIEERASRWVVIAPWFETG